MADLDGAFNLTQSENSEILAEWLLMSIRNGYQPANAKLDRFLWRSAGGSISSPCTRNSPKRPKEKHAQSGLR